MRIILDLQLQFLNMLLLYSSPTSVLITWKVGANAVPLGQDNTAAGEEFISVVVGFVVDGIAIVRRGAEAAPEAQLEAQLEAELPESESENAGSIGDI